MPGSDKDTYVTPVKKSRTYRRTWLILRFCFQQIPADSRTITTAVLLQFDTATKIFLRDHLPFALCAYQRPKGISNAFMMHERAY